MLSPQHLQTQDRFFEDHLEFCLSALAHCPWGFSRLSIDEDLLQSGSLSIQVAAGALPDGLVFDVPDADSVVPPRTIGDLWEPDQESMLAFLAVPEFRLDGINVASGNRDAQTRFVPDVVQRRDEVTGLGERPLQIARKNLRILLEQESIEGFSVLPFARVRRLATGEFRLDAEFVPPVLDFTCSLRLASIVRRAVELLSAKSNALSRMRRQRNASLAQFSVSDVANFWLLYTVNSHLPVLRHLADTRHGHPSELYEALLGLAGSLTTFSTSVHPRDFPPYDHSDLGKCFGALDVTLRILLETAVPENCVALPFQIVQHAVHAVALDEDRFLSAPHLYLAVRSDLPPAEIARLVPQLVKVTSGDRVGGLIKQAVAGIALTHLQSPPTAVPVKLDFQYFEIQRQGAEWNAVVSGRNIAAYVPSEISNASLELILLLAPKS